MPRRSILSVDLGTTRIKCGWLAETGSVTVVYTAPAPIAHPEAGATVQEPERVLEVCLEGLRRCAAVAPRPQALVLTGQMGGLIVVDRHGAALTPWITTMDTRAHAAALALRQEAGARIRRLTASAPEQAAFLRWLRQASVVSDDAVRDGTVLALLLAPYVATRLARGGLAAAYCDRTCLGWSGLAGVEAAAWDEELVRAARWSTAALPPIVAPGTTVGELALAVAAVTGLPAGLPLIAGPGDQAAGLYGLGVTHPGDVADSAATFPLLSGVTDHFFVPSSERVEVMPGALPGLWHPLSGLLGSGAMPAWYAETLSGATLAELEHEAEEAGSAAGLVALPYGALEAGGRRGVLWGLDPSHRRGHLYRAILEGIACEYALLAEDLAAEGVALRAPVVSYGGGSASPLPRRLKAAALGLPLRCLGAEEPTLAGAALLAARTLGWEIELALPDGDLVQPDSAAIQASRTSLETYRRLRQGVLQLMDGTV